MLHPLLRSHPLQIHHLRRSSNGLILHEARPDLIGDGFFIKKKF